MTTKIQTSSGPSAWEDIFAQDTSTTTGTTFGYKAGTVRLRTGDLEVISAGTVSCATGENVVYIDLSDNTVKAALTSANLSQRNTIWLHIVTVAGASITNVTDLRSWLHAGTTVL